MFLALEGAREQGQELDCTRLLGASRGTCRLVSALHEETGCDVVVEQESSEALRVYEIEGEVMVRKPVEQEQLIHLRVE